MLAKHISYITRSLTKSFKLIADEGMKYLVQKILDVAKVNTIPKPPEGTVEVKQSDSETQKSSGGCCN